MNVNKNVADGIIGSRALRGIRNLLNTTSDEPETDAPKEAISHKVPEAAEHARHAAKGHGGTSRKQPPREKTDGINNRERVAATA